MGEHRARVAIRIGDAVEAALHVAGSLSGSGGALDRIRGVAGPHKAAEHTTGPSPGGASQSGECRAADPGLGVGPCGRPDLRDCLARTVEPSELMSKERHEHWFAPVS